ncbi:MULTISPECIES: bifunctional diaminohydroxyphosphoribosylaminopyrimidine deaminase/5-amino-6-(5-phosphoribosylamino)uracil reductase RibD [unclassified Legionella]|uniref:bifunctional diaminohydroxyphosphoribosylaminopyrimidine deaminase/5-amino-6-(5-phosphoribosylamino)uracil reductase RibD n=1 Tax=unclassified Legionella TaxID=2622702 RepID=UPI001054A3B1|nr:MULTISPECIES: bifunctional diaminohydroxyphosphoribosylaminopyrimidine deaminase/5-amino-6-(5-phosphoribosylamino)uracil reductase RibD [unclassified Legionella]MDI9819314.1 bifunctional diaminohydroxyphosphoribosylaminopyrimidine deaminase/5-amino-6-(5-phosphoribosylamino)uracil reductase RibD [Legionella sp. PL877]
MHKHFMLAALEQAWLGRGICAPNPSVGAVAVCNGEIIARAWHRGAGTEHAEQLLLKQIPQGMPNVTLYVTLEPCNHWGRTSPCVSAIIQHGISEVVYAFHDPNPVVAANNTPEILLSKGINVIHYSLPEIDAFYQSYRYWTLNKKPWVTAKIAQSLDGKIAGLNGIRYQLSNSKCAQFTHQQRLYSDVIVTTAKTVHQDDPLLNVRLENKQQSKPLAILDARLSLSQEAKIFTSARHCHIYHDEIYTVKNPLPDCSYHAMPVKNGLLDLTAVINHLGSLGYHDAWIEAGGTLFSALHREGLLQRTYIYVVPEVLGDGAITAFHGNDIFSRKRTVSWQIKEDNVIACLDWQEDVCLRD